MIIWHALLPHASCFSDFSSFIAFASPADLSIWFICLSYRTCSVLESAPHISPSLSNVRWKGVLKASVSERCRRPLITNVEICNHMEAECMWETSEAVWALMHTALWILLECWSLMAWAIIITLMRRQDVHSDTSVMTTFGELYTSTSYMAWHTYNLSWIECEYEWKLESLNSLGALL